MGTAGRRGRRGAPAGCRPRWRRCTARCRQSSGSRSVWAPRRCRSLSLACAGGVSLSSTTASGTPTKVRFLFPSPAEQAGPYNSALANGPIQTRRNNALNLRCRCCCLASLASLCVVCPWSHSAHALCVLAHASGKYARSPLRPRRGVHNSAWPVELHVCVPPFSRASRATAIAMHVWYRHVICRRGLFVHSRVRKPLANQNGRQRAVRLPNGAQGRRRPKGDIRNFGKPEECNGGRCAWSHFEFAFANRFNFLYDWAESWLTEATESPAQIQPVVEGRHEAS